MDNIKIQTTQNVDIEYEVASIGDRILATLLDYLFFAAYFLLVFLLIWANNASFQSPYIYVLVALPVIFYDLFCESFFEGKSFGKMILKIKVVKLDGTQAGLGAYILRWILRIIDTRIFSGVVALIAIVINGKGQRIGDMAAGTTVIKMKQRASLNDTILNKTKPSYTLVFPEVAKLSDNDIAIIKEVMTLSLRTNNKEAIELLAIKTKAAMGVITNLPHIQFLSVVVQDYSFFDFEK